MASELAIKKEQKRQLYQLLWLKKTNPDIKINNLDLIINQLTAEMEKEDVAWVEKTIAELEI